MDQPRLHRADQPRLDITDLAPDGVGGPRQLQRRGVLAARPPGNGETLQHTAESQPVVGAAGERFRLLEQQQDPGEVPTHQRSCRNSQSTRDFPTPGSPTTATSSPL